MFFFLNAGLACTIVNKSTTVELPTRPNQQQTIEPVTKYNLKKVILFSGITNIGPLTKELPDDTGS